MVHPDVELGITRLTLQDLVVSCARGLDRGDPQLIASAFHADADVVTGFLDAMANDFAKGVVAMVRESMTSTFHSVANGYFEIAGNRAFGRSYVISHSLSAGKNPQETLLGGRYLDSFECRDGAWKISGRRLVTDWVMTQPSTLEILGMYETIKSRGGYYPDDPSVAFWALT